MTLKTKITISMALKHYRAYCDNRFRIVTTGEHKDMKGAGKIVDFYAKELSEIDQAIKELAE